MQCEFTKIELSITSWKVLDASHVTIVKAEYMGTNQVMCTLPDPKGSYVILVKCLDDLWSPRVTLLNYDDRCRTCSFGSNKKCETKVRVKYIIYCSNVHEN
ncbi:hypothetical protein NP493_8866g00003 [Ridgeia piscesae]|uniref:Uncharacterized protein n=1 Tax=Ridgeia piscesae TaxID=27915 RepID=A0AAD9MMI1_RIDPI|nr:hypothetical protein NP493_8866g00003 [Ridgeia piscesae]